MQPRVGYKLFESGKEKADQAKIKKEVEAPKMPLGTKHIRSLPQLQRPRLSPERQEAELKLWRNMLKPSIPLSANIRSQGELQSLKASEAAKPALKMRIKKINLNELG